jgi:hypothetical protein
MGVVLRGVVLRAAKAVLPAAALVAVGSALVPGSVTATTTSSHTAAPVVAPVAHRAPLGPVTVHPLAAPAPARTKAPASSTEAVQVVQLTVVGGALSLADESATVTLARHGSTWSAELPAVRVVDARGTHAGWTVRWTVTDVDVDGCRHPRVGASHVKVTPAAPVVVFGTADGLEAGRAAVGTAKHRTLGRAVAGSGGGTYEAGGTVSMKLPQCRGADAVTVALSYAVS